MGVKKNELINYESAKKPWRTMQAECRLAYYKLEGRSRKILRPQFRKPK